MSLKTKSTIKYASPIVREIDDFSQLEGLTGQYDNQQLSIISFLPNGFVGGGEMFWDASQLKSGHDGDFIISPTVPWTLTYSDYQAGTGETDPSGSGCWVRIGRAVGSVYEPTIDPPTGAIIESAETATGDYIIYADGTAIVDFVDSVTQSANIAAGAIFRTNIVLFNFPITFIAPPTVTPTINSDTFLSFAALNDAPSNTAITMGGFCPDSSGGGELGYIAKGKVF